MKRWFGLCVLGFVFGVNTACSVIQTCDPEVDPSCTDDTKGQIKGHIAVAGAEIAMLDAQPESLSLLQQARQAMNAAFQSHRAAQMKTLSELRVKRRLPTVSQANHIRSDWVAKERWRNGEVIINGNQDVRSHRDWWQTQLEIFLDGHYQVHVSLCNTATSCLLKILTLEQKPIGNWETWHLAQTLSHFEPIRDAEVNRILQIAAIPNDPFLENQWHYGAMHLQAAWELSTGHEDVVAAVIDTGALMDHPELKNKLLGSVDLIDDEQVAGDGNGRDNDGSDEGDNACGSGCHSHHGSHVAGTMAAQTDNGEMVAGVSWLGQVLAVRSLGRGGGSLFDIAGGLYWAIGSDVDGVDTNQNPADVINMSLGGRGESTTMNDAVAAATAQGAIVIVAAGNEGSEADAYTPANSPDAITVAAVGHSGGDRDRPKRTTYSNFGDVVDLAAPGGEQVEDVDGDGFPDGVLSTVREFVTYYQGTSMAAPHVAGVAMLMKALDPNISQRQARQVLTQTADSNIDCEGCGSGTIHAAKALLAMQDSLDTPFVVASPPSVRLGRNDLDAQVRVQNISEVNASLQIYIGGSERDLVSLNKTSLILAPDMEETLEITIARSGTDQGEAHLLLAYADGRIIKINLSWTEKYLNQAGSATVGALKIESDGSFTVERMVIATALTDFNYHLFNLTPGDYLILALTDDDRDGSLEDHEGVGVYPSLEARELISVAAKTTQEDIDFTVSPGFSPDEIPETGLGTGVIGAACSNNSDCDPALYCELVFTGGYCTSNCASGVPCPEGGTCFCLSDSGLGCDYSICLDQCEIDADCRQDEGYICDADNTCYPQ